jgi:hypothetical protein
VKFNRRVRKRKDRKEMGMEGVRRMLRVHIHHCDKASVRQLGVQLRTGGSCRVVRAERSKKRPQHEPEAQHGAPFILVRCPKLLLVDEIHVWRR